MQLQTAAAAICAISSLVLSIGCTTSDAVASQKTQNSIGAQTGERIDASAVTLRTAADNPVAMSILLEEGPAVIVFYRGSWCPYCEQALDGWNEAIGDLDAAGGRLIALTPDAPSNVAETLTKQDLGFTVLSDADAQAAKALRVNFLVDRPTRERYLGFGIDLEQSNASGVWQLPHPGTFIIDQDGTVLYANVDSDYREGRADPSEVVAAYRSIIGSRK